MGRERSTTICASNEEEYLNILKQKDSEKHLITISPKRKRSRLSSMIDGMENSPKNNQENFNEENFKLEFLHNEKDNNNNDIDKEEKLKNKEYCSIINCECYCDNLHCSPQENIDRYNDEYEEYSMLKENFKFEFDFIQPSSFELEKIKEKKLISDIQSLNLSFKTKEPEIFLSILNDIYQENYEGLSYKNYFFSNEDSLLNTPDKIRRCFSYDRIDSAEFQLNINTFKKSKENNSNSSSNTLSTNFMSKENSEKFSKFEVFDSINSNSNCLGFSIERNDSFGDCKTLQKSNLENIIAQNLIVSDETLKILIVGDKFTGKTTFVDNFCDGKISNGRYEETPSLDIRKKYFNFIGKYIKIELMDTNTLILNSKIIEAYYKLTNGYILICDIENLESIKFLEVQIEKISNFQNNFSNIFLIVNVKNECVSKKNSKNINYLKKICDKKEIKINYLHLCKQLNFSKILEKFINCCMILKKNQTNKTKRNSIKNLNKENLILNQFNKSEGSSIENDKIISNTRKSKKENCSIF